MAIGARGISGKKILGCKISMARREVSHFFVDDRTIATALFQSLEIFSLPGTEYEVIIFNSLKIHLFFIIVCAAGFFFGNCISITP